VATLADFLDGLSREAFPIAHDISSYSFPAMAKAARSRRWPHPASRTSASCAPASLPPCGDDRGRRQRSVAAFLLPDFAAGVSAEITYSNGGVSHVMGARSAPPDQSSCRISRRFC
jgi:hypothetical protein